MGMLLDEMRLENGIVVKIEDKTRLLSGNLYIVRMVLKVCVALGGKDAELKSVCGDTIVIEKLFEKSAVHKDDLDKVKNTFKDSFLATTVSYMKTEKFISRLKAKTLSEARDMQSLDERIRKGRKDG
jgi:hypothetical protein